MEQNKKKEDYPLTLGSINTGIYIIDISKQGKRLRGKLIVQ